MEGKMTEDERGKDMCPICKTDKYLSPNMNFLVNPECYHKICESCVDRIFSLGPAPCPYPKCGKILRKNKFKKQVFDDIAIEREIDIRKKVASIYNKTEDDFEDLQAFNKYLEEIENIIYNLKEGIEVEQTEAKLKAYEQDNKQEIMNKKLQMEKDVASFHQTQDHIKQLQDQRLKLQRQIELEEQSFKSTAKQQVLNNIQYSSSNPQDLINKMNQTLLKRSSSRKRQLQEITDQINQQSNPNSKSRTPIVSDIEMPFTPFNGDRELEKQYKLLPDYNDGRMDDFKSKEYLGAGFRVEQYLERALEEAFMGLGCFIQKEKLKV